MPPNAPIDLAGTNVEKQLKNMLLDFVADITDPQIEQFIAETLADWTTLGLMKADPTCNPVLLEQAKATLKARTETLAALPNLIAADKQQAFLGLMTSAGNWVVGTLFGVVRAYAGLPAPAPPRATDATTVGDVNRSV